jgi:hypothetical protein
LSRLRLLQTYPRPSPRSPLTVDSAAFRRHGTLAFVAKSTLYVLDGSSGGLITLRLPGYTASDPVLSADGKCLAYLETRTAQSGLDGSSQLWLARSDGQDAHAIALRGNVGIVGWSPTDEQLAFVDAPPVNASFTSTQITSLEVLSPNGRLRSVVSVRRTRQNLAELEGAAWSPDGDQLAYATAGLRRRVGAPSRASISKLMSPQRGCRSGRRPMSPVEPKRSSSLRVGGRPGALAYGSSMMEGRTTMTAPRSWRSCARTRRRSRSVRRCQTGRLTPSARRQPERWRSSPRHSEISEKAGPRPKRVPPAPCTALRFPRLRFGARPSRSPVRLVRTSLVFTPAKPGSEDSGVSLTLRGRPAVLASHAYEVQLLRRRTRRRLSGSMTMSCSSTICGLALHEQCPGRRALRYRSGPAMATTSCTSQRTVSGCCRFERDEPRVSLAHFSAELPSMTRTRLTITRSHSAPSSVGPASRPADS